MLACTDISLLALNAIYVILYLQAVQATDIKVNNMAKTTAIMVRLSDENLALFKALQRAGETTDSFMGRALHALPSM